MDVVAQLGSKFSSLDKQLESLSRQVRLHKRFLKHKFRREFEEFLCRRLEASASDSSISDDEDTPNVSVVGSPNSAETYERQRTSSTNQQDEQCEVVDEEKFRPSGFVEPTEPESLNTMRLIKNDANDEVPSDLETSASRRSEDSNTPRGTTSAAEIPSSSCNGFRRLQQVEEGSQGNLHERQFEASDSSVSDDEDSPDFLLAADAYFLNSLETEETYGLQEISSTNQQDEHCEDFEEENVHPSGFVETAEPEFVNTMRLSSTDANKEIPSDFEPSTSRRFEDTNSPSRVTPKAAIPSSSSNSVRRLQQKKQVKKKCEGNLPKVQSPMKLRNRLPNANQREQIATMKGTGDRHRTHSESYLENVMENDEDGKDSLASGGTSVDSSTSEDSAESDSESKRRKVGLGTRKTSAERKKRPRGRTPSGSLNLCPDKQNDPKEKRFECSVCLKRFHYACFLRYHQMTHTNEKPHKCSTCGKSFRQTSHLRGHELVHKNEKPYECYFCEKTFRQIKDLRSHLFTHSNEKPHKCSVCEKSFRTVTNLRAHKVTHTSKPHKCSSCSVSYRNREALQRHEERHRRSQ